MEGFLGVEYIGKNSESAWDLSQLMKYYKTTMKLDGKDVIVYLGQGFNIFENGRKPILSVLGWLDMDDPRVDEIYTNSNESYNFEIAPEPIQTEIDLSQVQVYLPELYEDDYNVSDSKQKRGRDKLGAQLFEMKKMLILGRRKEQFVARLEKDEIEHPKLKLDNILSELNEEEKTQARNLHDRMTKCVMMGKYSYRDYINFMNDLINIVRSKHCVYSSKERLTSIVNGHRTNTFKIPNNKFIARFCHDENRPHIKTNILDIDYGADRLCFVKNFIGNDNKTTDSTDLDR